MRWLVPLLLVGAALAALPAGHGQEPECDPCSCGAAYCEGGHIYWGVVRLDPVPDPINISQPFRLTWHLALVSNDPGAPPASGNWSHGQTGLVLSPGHIDNQTQPGTGNATDVVAGIHNATYPGTYSANVTFHEPETYYVRAWGTSWSEERVASTAERTGEGEPTTIMPVAAHRSPGFGGLAALAAVGACVAALRRRS